MEWKSFWLVLLVIVGVLLTGCGGINASKSFSPASFFLPGLGEARPAPTRTTVPSAPAPLESVITES